MKKKSNDGNRNVGGRKEVLIDAALEVFSEKGFVGSTTKDVAARAGVTDGLIYHYFSSKDELMKAVIEKHNFLTNMEAVFHLDDNQPIDDILNLLGNRLMDLMHQKSSFIVMFFGEAQRNPIIAEKLKNLVNEGVNILENYLNGRIAKGELKETSMSPIARHFLGSIFIYFLTYSRFQPETKRHEDSNEYIHSIVNAIYEGLKSK